MKLEDFVAKLDGVKTSWQGGYTALCPAHDDSRQSLSVREAEDGKLLVYCHAGCDVRDICLRLNLSVGDLFPGQAEAIKVAEYVYTDELGQPLYRVNRYQPKTFNQEHWRDGAWTSGVPSEIRRVPYLLPELLDFPGDRVFVVEGEKDVDNLASAGVVATTFVGGAGKWRPEYGEYFKGRRVIVVADNDEPGRIGAGTIAEGLRLGGCGEVEIRTPRAGYKDVTDLLLAGLSVEDGLVPLTGIDVFEPLDWDEYEHTPTEWLLRPYVPRGARVLAYGSKGSLKSLWAMWLAARLASEGERVAYFSLEMRASDTARRLKQLDPPKDNFLWLSKLEVDNPAQQRTLIETLKKYDVDLVVIDSWSAAFVEREYNEKIAELDKGFFLPLIEQTGATVLIIDNTGLATLTDKGKLEPDWARGASAKEDKTDIALYFRRPDPTNNYRTRIQVNKMRLDESMAAPLIIETPHDRIEFYIVKDGQMTTDPAWPGDKVEPEAETIVEEDDLPITEQLALARLKDYFKVKEIGKQVVEENREALDRLGDS